MILTTSTFKIKEDSLFSTWEEGEAEKDCFYGANLALRKKKDWKDYLGSFENYLYFSLKIFIEEAETLTRPEILKYKAFILNWRTSPR